MFLLEEEELEEEIMGTRMVSVEEGSEEEEVGM